MKPGVESEQGDDDFRRVAEGDVQQSADPGTATGRKLFGRTPHQSRGGNDPKCRRSKDQRGVRMEDLDTPRVVRGASEDILATLEAAGMRWDGPVVHAKNRRMWSATPMRLP